MKITTIITACALAISAGAGFTQDYQAPFTSYFAFGDSLTDDGKFGELPPPSFGGRFSNGITYAEGIALDFAGQGKLTFNFALGGATAGDVNLTPYPDAAAAAPFATFGNQVGTFSGLFGGLQAVGDNPLFSVLFGGNDLFQNLTTNSNIGVEAANAVKAGIEAIGALNENYDSFVVANLPNLAGSPRYSGSDLEETSRVQSDIFNAQLAANIDMLRDDGFEIIELDIDALFASIVADPGALGIENVDTPCTPSLTEFDPFNNCAFNPLTFEIDLDAADAFAFVDNVHPNRIVQAATADEFRSSVAAATDLAPVPLPAGLPLLIAGLGAFGILRMRRAA